MTKTTYNIRDGTKRTIKSIIGDPGFLGMELDKILEDRFGGIIVETYDKGDSNVLWNIEYGNCQGDIQSNRDNIKDSLRWLAINIKKIDVEYVTGVQLDFSVIENIVQYKISFMFKPKESFLTPFDGVTQDEWELIRLGMFIEHYRVD